MLYDPELLLCRSLRLTEKLGSPGIEALADLGLLKARREMAAAAHLGIEPRSALQTFHIHQVCRDADVARPYRDRAITELLHEPIDWFAVGRSEERRVGKECGSTCRSRWCPYH